MKNIRSGVKTLQAAEPPYSNGRIKNSENIGKWRMIYEIGLYITMLLIVQRNEQGGWFLFLYCYVVVLKYHSVFQKLGVKTIFKYYYLVLRGAPEGLSELWQPSLVNYGTDRWLYDCLLAACRSAASETEDGTT